MCPRSAPSTWTDGRQRRLAILGHRGGALEAPENSLAAIAHAVACGADGVELDLRLSADGVPVVVHDADLARLARCQIRVAEATAAELAALPLLSGAPGGVPTLAQALAAATPLRWLDLELKAGSEPGRLASAVIAVLAAAARTRGVLLTSFDPEALAALRRLAPGVPCGRILDAPPAEADWAELPAVALELALARAGWAREARARNLAVLVWTENDPARLAAWRAAGVDGVITDRPALFAGLDPAPRRARRARELQSGKLRL